MRAVAQRVSSAAVRVDRESVGEIGAGLLVLLAVGHGDDEALADRMADKLRAMRLWGERMSEPLGERAVLVVSQFTLLADVRRGTRPSFTAAAAPERARELYERVADRLDAQRGVFGAHMEVESVGDGPVTIVVDLPHAA